MLGNKLIRRSYSGPHLTCIKYPQTLEVLCKIHYGECGNHSGGRSLAQKAINKGYFWPTMRHDSAEYVKKCDRCQRYKPMPNLPAEVYHPQNSLWPFMQWAIDLIGPLPPAPAKKEMMIVATDYFTTWIEAEALSSTKEADVERFIWRNIICRFGCPQSLVTDNDSQFIGKQITTFFAKYKIKQHLSTPRYPQGNGQAEASNKVILDCLKTRLEGAEGKWVDELSGVLWAYRTTKRRSTGETSFSFTFGTKAIIPPHITVPSISLEVGSVDQNSEQMRLNLDLLEGEREKTIIRVASYQQQLKSYHDKRAKIRRFQPGNLGEREAEKTNEYWANILMGKFAPTIYMSVQTIFKALKNGQKDKWDEECEVAFQSLKTYLTSPPLLSILVPGEDLFVYLAVSNSAISSALIREELGAQHPIFYTSKALLDAETRYPKLEKLILALVVSARKLRPYYQAHRVVVMTDFPLRSILYSPDASQRLIKWAIELSQYDLLYRPKTAIKAQALADFVAEFTPSTEEEKLGEREAEKTKESWANILVGKFAPTIFITS
ncbi:hypothetical protein L3X38_007276 [Prunus dulcis]|uniref:Integrase catalytic domain-containing protein n=1 Tax=Prunus dulcis TaxID=3755 RepID=A0AAD4ZUM8_PRUDU|nr:hypothetical protein L3X38_007276 [Prunus dulcis]